MAAECAVPSQRLKVSKGAVDLRRLPLTIIPCNKKNDGRYMPVSTEFNTADEEVEIDFLSI